MPPFRRPQKTPCHKAEQRSIERHSPERPSVFPSMSTHNHIYYVEFQASDLTKTKAFFQLVFGWTFTDYGPDYTSFADSGLAGGFARSEKKASLAAGGPLVVILSNQLENTLHEVVAHGGTVTLDIFPYPGGRRFHFTEPSGNELAVCAEA
jgi:predicted enzyme related to lactoylglutathione lyase